jgi:hypothetical protein
MNAINDGGPAFPGGHVIEKDSDHYGEPYWDGMSLRDYFAGQALAAVLIESDPQEPHPSNTRVAERAYGIADAMLAERERQL